MKFNYRCKVFFATLTVFIILNSCTKNNGGETQPEEAKYSAVLCVGAWPNTAYYISSISSLMEGTITAKGQGAEMTGKVYAQDILQKDGFYYHANSGSGRFGKYHVEGGAVIVDKEIPYTWLDWSSYAWINETTVVILGTGKNTSEKNEFRYSIVNTTDMSVVNGSLNVGSFPSGFTNYAPGFAEYKNNQLIVGFQFVSEDWSTYPDMPVDKKLNVAIVDYPAMTVNKVITHTGSTSPGGPKVYAPTSFIDENNDLYFVTTPLYNYDYESPSMVYKIKNGTTEIDESYALNLSSKSEDGKAAAIWYIGNGKAIVRTTVAGTSIDADHFFTLIDARNGSFIKKLNLPADKGERMVQAVIVESGKAYIAVNAEDKDYIWEYDPATDKLTAGAEFIGGIDYILRLEKVK